MQFLRYIAFPVSLIYGMVVHLRNWCYDVGLFSSKSFKTPTVCVGNLSVGGTGKTPMVEYLIGLLRENYKIAVLSRGYKRKTKGYVLADANATVAQLGDEPYQIFSKFDDLSLAVDADRQNGIATLEQNVTPDVILLDDAFQHRKVIPTFNILLTTYDKLFVNDTFLPTGTLRDAKNQKKRAHVIVVTKCPMDLGKEEQTKVKEQLDVTVPVLFASLSYAPLLISKNKEMELSSLQGKHFTLVTGIANPKPLVGHLTSKGLDFEHLNYPDHHSFSAGELEKLKTYPLVLTTEKDYVRLKDKLENLYFIGVKHHFLGDGAIMLKEFLHNGITNHSQSWN